MKSPLLLTLAAACALSACATTPPHGLESPGFRIPVGSSLQLTRVIVIPAERATVYLQDGQVAGGVDETSPYCIFEVRTLSDAPRAVPPEIFTIHRVRRMVHFFGGVPGNRYASADSDSGSGGPSHMFYKTVLSLRAANPSDAMQMTCQSDQLGPSGPAFARHLTVTEIRGALGDWFTLTLAEPGRASGAN